MFLCKRVRSEMGVDSVGVGGGEPGGVRGRCAPVGGDPPRRRVHPLALREWAGVFFIFGALGGPAVHGCCRSPAAAVRPPPRRRRVVAAPLGGPRGSVAGRLGRRWWCRGDPAQGRGEGQEGGVPLPGPLPRPPPSGGARGPGSDWRKAPGARRAASSSGAVQARAPGGGAPLAVPCGRRTARVARTGVDHAGGDHGAGPGPPRAASGRPAGPSQYTISTPRPRPCWPARRTRGALQGGPLPVPGGPDPQGHVLGRRPCPAPTAMRVRASPAPGGRGRTIGADRARGGPAGWKATRRPAPPLHDGTGAPRR